jgi:hypothetical protein
MRVGSITGPARPARKLAPWGTISLNESQCRYAIDDSSVWLVKPLCTPGVIPPLMACTYQSGDLQIVGRRCCSAAGAGQAELFRDFEACLRTDDGRPAPVQVKVALAGGSAETFFCLVVGAVTLTTWSVQRSDQWPEQAATNAHNDTRSHAQLSRKWQRCWSMLQPFRDASFSSNRDRPAGPNEPVGPWRSSLMKRFGVPTSY